MWNTLLVDIKKNKLIIVKSADFIGVPQGKFE